MPLQCLPADVPEATHAAWHEDRSTRYLARVDLHLASGLSRQQKLRFLSAQLAAWQRAFAKFICRKTGGAPVGADSPSASDFLLTIVGLQNRLTQTKENP